MYQYSFLIGILYICCFLNTSKSIVLSTNLHKMLEGFMEESNLYFGLASHYYFNKLTQSNNLPIFCIFHFSNFDRIKTNSITFKNEILQYKDLESSLLFNFLNIKLTFFVIDLDIDSNSKKCYERLAFPHKTTHDVKYSLIDSFITQYPTNNKQYSFIPRSDSPGLLYLGNVPQDVIDTKYNTSCKVHPLKNEWSCSLRRINYINHNTHVDIVTNYNYDNYFDIGENAFMYLNDILLNDIKDKVFGELITKGICEYDSNVDRKYPFKCECNAVFGNDVLIGDIEIMFDNNVKLIFTAKDYFMKLAVDYRSNMCNCLISHLSLSENAEYNGNERVIVFGGSFMEKFNVLTFDYERDEVVFYSDIPFQYEDNINCTIKIIYQIILLGLLINSIVCIFILFINNKR